MERWSRFSNVIFKFCSRLELIEAQETAVCWWLVDLELEARCWT
jgi:hypothetical protein